MASSPTVASVVAPSRKLTDPVGVPAVLVTAAVSATDCPVVAGFTDDVTVVLVDPRITDWARTAEVLAVKFALPEYLAVIE